MSFVTVNDIPGNVLQGDWRAAWYISEEGTDDQFESIRALFAGELGGPLADLAGLFGDIVTVERAPIRHETTNSRGTLAIGDAVDSEVEPYRSPDGQSITTLRDSLFSTVLRSPACVAKAAVNRVDPRITT